MQLLAGERVKVGEHSFFFLTSIRFHKEFGESGFPFAFPSYGAPRNSEVKRFIHNNTKNTSTAVDKEEQYGAVFLFPSHVRAPPHVFLFAPRFLLLSGGKTPEL